MPTYDYSCNQCGHRFESFQRMSDDPLKDCPDCGGEVQRLISGGTGLIFKGSGFYITDYKNKANGKTKTEKTEGKPEKKAESNKENQNAGTTEKKKPVVKSGDSTTKD